MHRYINAVSGVYLAFQNRILVNFWTWSIKKHLLYSPSSCKNDMGFLWWLSTTSSQEYAPRLRSPKDVPKRYTRRHKLKILCLMQRKLRQSVFNCVIVAANKLWTTADSAAKARRFFKHVPNLKFWKQFRNIPICTLSKFWHKLNHALEAFSKWVQIFEVPWISYPERLGKSLQAMYRFANCGTECG